MNEIIQLTDAALVPPRDSRWAIRRWAARRAGGVLLTHGLRGLAATATARSSHPGELPPRAGRPCSAVPRGLWELDAEWLTAALCGSVPGARVLEARITAAAQATSGRARVELTYDRRGSDAGLPASVFVKCTSSLAQRLMIGLGGLIGGEPGFYAHVRPLLAIEAPHGHLAAIDPVSWHSILVIEDVCATRGARFWGLDRELSAERLGTLLGDLATVHGSLWRSPALERWRWLRTPAEQATLIDALLGFADRTAAGIRRAGPAIPRALRERSPQLQEALRRSLRAATEGPHTYLHGDLHAANLYLTADGRAGICDWQASLKGSWALDLAYLLATSMRPEQRREHERQLLELYLQRLAQAGGDRISPRSAWQAYRRATVYPYFAWLYTLGRARLQPAFQPETVSREMVARLAQAIDDLGSFEALGL